MHRNEKEFSSLATKKEETEQKKISMQFKKREIFWMRIGENIGFEQSGKGIDFMRPIIVYKKFSSRVFWGIPLTTKPKKGKFYFAFEFLEKKQNAILSQLRLFDAKRLEEKLGVISKINFRKLEKAIQRLMDDF